MHNQNGKQKGTAEANPIKTYPPLRKITTGIPTTALLLYMLSETTLINE